MDEEAKKSAEELNKLSKEFDISLQTPQDEYIPGSAAPQIEQPQQQPDTTPEPEQKPKPTPKPKIRRPSYKFSSVLTIIGIIVVASCAFFLLSREVAIQQQINAITELKKDINELYVERDYLYTKYNSSIDITAIRKRAEQYGMHAPEDGQLIELE